MAVGLWLSERLQVLSFVLHESLISFSSVQVNFQTALLQVHTVAQAAFLILPFPQDPDGES